MAQNIFDFGQFNNMSRMQNPLPTAPKTSAPATLNFGAPMSGATNFQTDIATKVTVPGQQAKSSTPNFLTQNVKPQPTPSLKIPGIAQANASDEGIGNIDNEKVKRFIEHGKSLGKNKDEIFGAYQKALNDGLFNKEIITEEQPGLLEGLKYKPYTPEELSNYDENKGITQNLLEGQGRYLKNVVGGAYNILPGVAQLATGLVGGVAEDIKQNVGYTFGLISEEDLLKYKEEKAGKTGALISGVINDYKTKYGSQEGFTNAVMTDPTSIIGDALSVIGLGIAGKTKLTNIQKGALETQKANIINEVKNATTLEQKSSLIKQGIEASKQIVEKTKQVNNLKDAQAIVNKYNPYLKVPEIAGKTALGVIKSPKKILQNELLTRKVPIKIVENNLGLTTTERGKIEDITGKKAGVFVLERNLSKDKEILVNQLQKLGDDSYNGITEQLKNMPQIKTKSENAVKMLDTMLDEMNSSNILKREYGEYINKLQQLKDEGIYTINEKNAIRRDFDKIVGRKIFDSKGRVSGAEDELIAKWRSNLSDEVQNEALKNGIDVRAMNNDLRASIIMRDGVLRRLSQENKNNIIGLQDIGVGAILSAGNPITATLLITGKKLLEKQSPNIVQKLYNLNPTPYAKSNIKRGVSITPRDKSNGFSIASDNNVSKPVVKLKKQLLLPQGKAPNKPIITPQTAEKGVILESKKGLSKTKTGLKTEKLQTLLKEAKQNEKLATTEKAKLGFKKQQEDLQDLLKNIQTSKKE